MEERYPIIGQMASAPCILFRTDASTAIGIGHAMRCLSLAAAMKRRGWKPVFCMGETVAGIERRMERAIDIRRMTSVLGSDADARETLDLAVKIDTTWVIVDGYHFGDEYQRLLKEGRSAVLCIDDYGQCTSPCADLVLNQNLSANESLYANRSKHTRLLLGAEYILLQPSFIERGRAARAVPTVAQNILVTLGGGDPQNITAKVLRALHDISPMNLEITVILGGANPHASVVKEIAAELPHSTEIVVDAEDMPERMAHADVAIAAAGTTSYELLFMGVPFITGAFAENQRAIAEALGAKQLATNVGWYPDVPQERLMEEIHTLVTNQALRADRSIRGWQIVDGKGADRVMEAIQSQT
jgi:UDP-2,4-diacetamido-2,4,6-trideoxy-beta-L-altropyranose hydrolase